MAAVSVAAMLERLEREIVSLFNTPATKCFLNAMATVPMPISEAVSHDVVRRVIHDVASDVVPDPSARSTAVNRIFMWIANMRRLVAACRAECGDDATCSGLVATFLWTFRAEIAKCVLFGEHVIFMPDVVQILGKRTLEVAVLKRFMTEHATVFAEMDAAAVATETAGKYR